MPPELVNVVDPPRYEILASMIVALEKSWSMLQASPSAGSASPARVREGIRRLLRDHVGR